MRIVFFGTPVLTTIVLEKLVTYDLAPSLIVTNSDKPVGRKQLITPSPAKQWAQNHGIATLSIDKFSETLPTELTERSWDIFLVFAYGVLLPRTVIDLPQHGTLNLHPSLLPQLRGPSPIRSAILQDRQTTGVSIMQMDELMDHGPIVAQKTITIPDNQWPAYGPHLDEHLITEGAELLCNTILGWHTGEIQSTAQDHTKATYCHKLTKDMGQLAIDPYNLPTGAAAHTMLRKIRALAGWPETYFIFNGIRIKIKAAELASNDSLHITRIIPAGKSEMDFSHYFNIS